MPPYLEKKLMIFPIRRFISKNNLKTVSLTEKKPNLLLSQINGLDREIIEQLEMARIFDTNDFFETVNQLEYYLGLNRDEIESIKEQIENMISKKVKPMTLHVELPQNYAILSLASDHQNNVLDMIWKHLRITLSNPIDEGWNLVKFEFDKIYQDMNQPDLIVNKSSYNKWPTWLNSAVDISNIIELPNNNSIDDFFSTINLDWDFGIGNSKIIAKLITAQIGYLIYVAKKKKETILLPT